MALARKRTGVISLLTPTRKRPDRLMKMISSAIATAKRPLEIIVYVADDDPSYDNLFLEGHLHSIVAIKMIRGPRFPAGGTFSDLWNGLIPHAAGDIFMQCADDVFFRTQGWDDAVEKAYEACPDKLLLVYADDLGPSGKIFATLPFVSRRWVEVVGYFTGPGFAADFSDAWPQDVAEMIGRKRFLAGVEIEHQHWMWGKAAKDATYAENLERYLAQQSNKVYASRLDERKRDADKLRQAIKEFACVSTT